MDKVINVYKPVSLTPLQVVNRFKEQFPEYAESKISYAGRLDPLAEGVLILLVDEENKEREKYQRMDKEYEFEVLFGAETDTYDLLGIVKKSLPPNRHSELVSESTTQSSNDKVQISRQKGGQANRCQSSKPKKFDIWILDLIWHLTFGFWNSCRQALKRTQKSETKKLEERIKQFAKSLVGRHAQPYPPFSSFQIQKKPLFQWAKEGRLSEIEIPTKEIEIYSIKHLGTYQIGSEELHQQIIERVSKVQGKFRQQEILKRWQIFFDNITKSVQIHTRHSGEVRSKAKDDDRISEILSPPLRRVQSDKLFPVMKFRIHCGSGTYVRQIAYEMGQLAGSGALALNIKRTRVGEYKLNDSVYVESCI